MLTMFNKPKILYTEESNLPANAGNSGYACKDIWVSGYAGRISRISTRSIRRLTARPLTSLTSVNAVIARSSSFALQSTPLSKSFLLICRQKSVTSVRLSSMTEKPNAGWLLDPIKPCRRNMFQNRLHE